MENSARNVGQLLKQALGKKCWYVTVGGCTLPQFKLELGNKVRRKKPIRNSALARQVREFEGEISLFIRCWWRLEHGSSVVVSSIDREKAIVKGLERLVGERIKAIKVNEPAWDLLLEFSNDWHLRVFGSQTENDSDLLKNWHARIRAQRIYAGPGAKIEIVR
jgi:hypothetical protein